MLRVFRELHIHVNLITPYKNLNLARESARSLLITERDAECHESQLCEVTWEEIDRRLEASAQQALALENEIEFGQSRARISRDRLGPFTAASARHPPPAGMDHLRNLVGQWRQWQRPEQVQWEARRFRHLGTWRLPVALHIDSMQALLDCHCIAIFGGGRNLQWMHAPWLADRRIAYWGDIDSWGLTILGEARTHQPRLQSLMMDTETLQRFAQFQVTEPVPRTDRPKALTPEEYELWERLRKESNIRLEQERLPQDYVRSRLTSWLHG